MAAGRITCKTDSEFTFGLKPRERASLCEIDTKVNGRMACDKDTASSTMQMGQSTKANG